MGHLDSTANLDSGKPLSKNFRLWLCRLDVSYIISTSQENQRITFAEKSNSMVLSVSNDWVLNKSLRSADSLSFTHDFLVKYCCYHPRFSPGTVSVIRIFRIQNLWRFSRLDFPKTRYSRTQAYRIWSPRREVCKLFGCH